MKLLTRFLIMIFLQSFALTGFFAALSPAPVCAEENADSKTTGDNASPQANFNNVAISENGPLVNIVVVPTKITVYLAGPVPQLLQEMPCDNYSFAEDEVSEDEDYLSKVVRNAFVEIIDMNFDGYQDIKVISSKGNVNVYYDCWLWDQDKKMFALNEELSALALPSFNSESKTIDSYTHISATDNLEATYIFRNGKLQPVEFIEQSYDQKRKLFITQVHRDDENGAGQLKLVFQRELTEQEMTDKINTPGEWPFPGALEYYSEKGFSLMLPEDVSVNETAEELSIKSKNWVVIVNKPASVVANLDNHDVQVGLEENALTQSPLARGKIEWAYGTDTTPLNFYNFYRRPFTGTFDGLTVEMGQFYYANINGKHFRIICIQLSDADEGNMLFGKMLDTLSVK